MTWPKGYARAPIGVKRDCGGLQPARLESPAKQGQLLEPIAVNQYHRPGTGGSLTVNAGGYITMLGAYRTASVLAPWVPVQSRPRNEPGTALIDRKAVTDRSCRGASAALRPFPRRPASRSPEASRPGGWNDLPVSDGLPPTTWVASW
jgi:hypothetical protein